MLLNLVFEGKKMDGLEKVFQSGAYYYRRSFPVTHNGHISLLEWGVDEEKLGWSLAGLNCSGDAGKHPRYGRILERLDQAAEALRLRSIFSPSPVGKAFGVIVDPDSAPWSEVPLPDSGATLHRGVVADGVRHLTSGEGFAISAAGCYLLVLNSEKTGRATIAHVGTKSLFDPARLSGQKPRRFESTVIRALQGFLLRGENSRDIFAYLLVGIGARRLRYSPQDPVHGSFNTALHAHLKASWGYEGGPEGVIDIPEIVRRQLGAYEVPAKNVFHDGVCAYEHEGLYCHPYDVHPETREPLRNLFLIGISPA